MDEPDIVINGVRLTKAQAMTVRVAIGSFYMDMMQPDALGDDEHGKAMAAGYKERLREVTFLMVGVQNGRRT